MAEPVRLVEQKEMLEEPSASKARLIRTVVIIIAATILGFLSLCFFVTRRLADFYFALMTEGE